MPGNEGTTKVWYMVLDESLFSFDYQSFEYDFHTVQNLMNENGLPKAYSETLATGFWDNCEILPDIETEEQGKVLILWNLNILFIFLLNTPHITYYT